jgi:hypothetical protein
VFRQKVEITVKPGLRRGTGEEARAAVIDVVDEEAVYRVGEQVREHQPVGVNDVVPQLPYTAGGGEVAWPEAAEYVGDGVVRQDLRMIHGFRDLVDCRRPAAAAAAALRFSGRESMQLPMEGFVRSRRKTGFAGLLICRYNTVGWLDNNIGRVAKQQC